MSCCRSSLPASMQFAIWFASMVSSNVFPPHWRKSAEDVGYDVRKNHIEFYLLGSLFTVKFDCQWARPFLFSGGNLRKFANAGRKHGEVHV